MSDIEDTQDTHNAKTNALDWLEKAVNAENAPESAKAKALAYRSGFYRKAAQSFSMSEQWRVLKRALQDANEADISSETVQDQLLALAREDLDNASRLEVKDPRVYLFLTAEWIAHDELEQAEAKLRAADHLSQETIEKYYLDVNDWTVARFLLASDLALRRGVNAEDISLVDDVLTALREPRRRIRVLPAAIRLYVSGGRISNARNCLDEYTKAVLTQQEVEDSKLNRAYLQALVAKAEDRLYTIIDVLRPIVVSETSRPELWRLLAEAYTRTDQSRRAIDALKKYLRLRPNDSKMTLQLAKEYIKLQDWNRAFETARLAEPLDPRNIIIKLLRLKSSFYLTASQSNTVDKSKLDALSAELADLREDHPENVDIRILQAAIAIYLKQYKTAERELKLAIEECDEPLRAEMQLVRLYYRTKHMNKAVSLCEAACKHHAEVAEPWLSLSGLHVANADYDSAFRCLRDGLKAVNGPWETRSVSIQLALLEILHGDQDAGIALLDDLAAKDPQEVRARTLLLEVPKVQENKAKADKIIAELKEAEGESGLFWRLHQASLWLSSEDWRSKELDIRDLLQYCISSDPEWSAPVLLMVKMYEKSRNYGRVEEVCRQALTRNPSAIDIADALISLLEKERRFSDAEKVLGQIDTNPRSTSAWNVRIAVNAGDFSRAIDELKLRVANDDQDANSRILLARLLYWRDRNADQAFVYLKEAEAITPRSMALTAAKASILRAEGQTAEAHQVLDEYVVNSEGFGAYMMRAEYNAADGEFERAEKDYQKLIDFAEQGTAGYILLSNFYVTNEKLDKALATLEEGLKKYPDDLRLKRRLMQFLFARGKAHDRERATELLTALEKQLPQDPELMKLRAMQYLQEQTPQSLEASKKKLETAVRLEPTAVDAQLFLIRILMQQRQYKIARDYAIRAIGSNPSNPVLLSARSEVERALKNYPMAIQLAQLALRKDPNNVPTMVSLAEAYRLSGDLDRSEQWIKRAEQLDPNNPTVFGTRCLWLGSKKRFEELTRIGSTFVSTKEQNVQKVLNVASILSRADPIEFKREAVKLYEYALTLSATGIDVNRSLALTLYQIGNAERAKRIYRELLEQYPDNIQVLNDLAWILQEHDRSYEAALELANRGLKIGPDDEHLLDTKGTILLNMKDRLVDARKVFETLEQSSPPSSPRQAKTLLKLGRICAQLNDSVRARQHLKRALEIDQTTGTFTPDERAEIARILRDLDQQTAGVNAALSKKEPK
ncbi:MAG: tetratricopeptide repeat protein [Sedimentisphaerales bacterium]